MFFVNWQLWEEMTFILACAIVVVFIMGLIKLWWTNRSVRRQEQLDEEKRARLTEMRRVGLSPRKKRTGEIPFGIRAIQSGIEVEGIWISHPTTPSRSSSKSKLGHSTSSSATNADGIVGSDNNNDDNSNNSTTRAARQTYLSPPADGDEAKHRSTLGGGRGRLALQRTPASSPLAGEYRSCPAQESEAEMHSDASTPLPQISEDAAFPPFRRTNESSHTFGIPHEDALWHLDDHYVPSPPPPPAPLSRSPQPAAYIPSSRNTPSRFYHQYQPYPPQQRQQNYSPVHGYYRPNRQGNGGSAAEYASVGSGSSRGSSSRSSRSSRSSSSLSAGSLRQQYQQPPGQSGGPSYPAASGTPLRARDYKYPGSGPGPSSGSASAVNPPLATHGPGDAYANRATRRVNSAFEVLPAGTFGGFPHVNNADSSNRDDSPDPGSRTRPWISVADPPPRNRLRKSGLP